MLMDIILLDSKSRSLRVLKPTYLGIVMFQTVLYACVLFGVCQSSEAVAYCLVISDWFNETCNERWPYSDLRIKVDKQQDSRSQLFFFRRYISLCETCYM
jgi:hypothetical protein